MAQIPLPQKQIITETIETAACYQARLTALIWFCVSMLHGNKMFTDNSANKKYALWHFSGCLVGVRVHQVKKFHRL